MRLQHLFVGGRELVDATSIAASGLNHDAELTLVVDAADATTSSTMTLADRPRNFTLKTLTGKSVALTLSKVRNKTTMCLCAPVSSSQCHCFRPIRFASLRTRFKTKKAFRVSLL